MRSRSGQSYSRDKMAPRVARDGGHLAELERLTGIPPIGGTKP